MDGKWKALAAGLTALAVLGGPVVGYYWPKAQEAKAPQSQEWIERYAESSASLAVCEFRASQAERDLVECETERWKANQ